MNSKIDIVLPWVDGSDPEWQKVKKESLKKYCPAEAANSNIRFESWDNLQYWFRAVETYMPWVHKIFFLTWGHLPEFLDTAHPKLEIVRHEDYIPKEYLPTFNSGPIEMNVHRIDGLAENYIMFNDDFFPLQPIAEEYYFRNDMVCDEAVENVIVTATMGPIVNMARYMQVNNMFIINRHFQKREVQKKHWDKWYCEDYGELLERTKSLQYWNDFPGFHDPHMACGLKKSVLKKIWELEEKDLDKASREHFRGPADINHYLVRYWQLCEGNFCPRKTKGKMCLVNMDNYQEYAQGIREQRWQMVSLNEDCTPEEFEVIKKEINGALEQLLPDKSTFER